MKLRLSLLAFLLVLAVDGMLGQQVWFFSEGTGATFYDQGIVDVANLGGSSFEYTHPPGLPQFNDKVPCSATAWSGSTSLKFNYTSAASGNWKATIYRSDWSVADITGMEFLGFYLYAGSGLPASALPKIGLVANRLGGGGDATSLLYDLSAHNDDVPADQWVEVKIPLSVFIEDGGNALLDFTRVKGVVFSQSEVNGVPRLLFIDDIKAFVSMDVVPPVSQLKAEGFDSHVELRWQQPLDFLSYRIYARYAGSEDYVQIAETDKDYYLHFVPQSARNTEISYKVEAFSQDKESDAVTIQATVRDFTDEELLDMFQRYTFRYFWEGAHQPSGMALERTNGDGRTVASGATGMGLMAMVVAYERAYEERAEIKTRILKILEFLENCERHKGAWAHWYNGDTYQTQPFSSLDDGGDLVETSFVAQALITLRNYFRDEDAQSVQIRQKATLLWEAIDWNWYRNGNQNVLYWHWSPNHGFAMNMKIQGWNESLITYVMAAASPTFGINKETYTQGWARNGSMVNPRTYYEHPISLSPNWGGPLFWIHYSHLGLNPKGLSDQYADYWQEHVNTAKIHHAYAVNNPLGHQNYSENNWGLTASDDPFGYTAHEPMNNDNGTISPTAALASMPFTPMESMKALKYFYRERGADLFGLYGPYDAFNDNMGWVQKSYIGIDQGPIVVMIENHRTGLLWKHFMADAEVQAGLDKLGFSYQATSAAPGLEHSELINLFPNPAVDNVSIELPHHLVGRQIAVAIYATDGSQVYSSVFESSETIYTINCSAVQNGFYLLKMVSGSRVYRAKLIIRK
ncbi:glucoamylase family protein [Alkaliflexus imshenetskii]|uniref:glucoamylase family protein n=1 Tax=Alkaliflexus imshenetskii TaxID=286730 RepID=UPI0004BB0B65|nr:glucoamylase family protein [Alkaliflexus imshenetskii]